MSGFFEKVGEILTGGIGKEITDIIGKRIADKDLAAQLDHDIKAKIVDGQQRLQEAGATLEQTIVEGQNKINELEAQSGNLFASGWRPAVGWSCVVGLIYQFLLQPLAVWLSGIFTWMPPPALELGTLITLLFGMLGLGAMRTTERVQGVIPPGK